MLYMENSTKAIVGDSVNEAIERMAARIEEQETKIFELEKKILRKLVKAEQLHKKEVEDAKRKQFTEDNMKRSQKFFEETEDRRKQEALVQRIVQAIKTGR